jgi:predicted nucleotidyltransferase component of viral defense system
MREDIRKTIRLVKFDRNILRRLADHTGAGRRTVEKDFLISIFFILLSFDKQFAPFLEKIVFRGGTCLKKAYFPNQTRFSEDLDFILPSLGEMNAFHGVLEGLVGEDLGVTAITRAEKTDEYSKGFNIHLGYTSVLGQPDHIMFNLNANKTMMDSEQRRIDVMPYFPSIRPAISVMSIREILAEKVRALLQRAKPRDVFDVWFLTVKKGMRIDHAMLKKKLQRSYEAAPEAKKESALSYSVSDVLERIKGITELAWKQELGGLLLRKSPSRETIVSDVSKILKRVGDVSLNPTRDG